MEFRGPRKQIIATKRTNGQTVLIYEVPKAHRFYFIGSLMHVLKDTPEGGCAVEVFDENDVHVMFLHTKLISDAPLVQGCRAGSAWAMTFLEGHKFVLRSDTQGLIVEATVFGIETLGGKIE